MVDAIRTNLWAMLGYVVIKVHFLPVEFHWVKAGINLYQQMSKEIHLDLLPGFCYYKSARS